MKKNALKTKNGFTLVELSLAVAFISLILLIMAALTISLIAIYRKGITIDSVNTVGRSIIEDFQNSIAATDRSQSPESICGRYYDKSTSGYTHCVNDRAMKLIYQEFTDPSHKPYRGVFCTGSYSYVWNTPYANDNSKKFKVNGKLDFRLYKIHDEDRRICATLLNTSSKSYSTNPTTDLKNGWELNELISQSDNTLWVYHVYVAPLAISEETSNVFYSGSFILATKEGGVNIMSTGDYCKPPGGTTGEENFNYCAINKFNFAVQGNGG